MLSNSFSTPIQSLYSWYRSHARVLPWRDDPTPYKVWISEIMLQQTQVAAVIPFFERFIKRFPDLDTLAAATEDDVMQYWAGLGYYSRARNIHKSARLIHQKNSFPESRTELLELPGIGPYTAGAILSIAFNQAVPILDANIERVLSRMRLLSGPQFKKQLWIDSELIIKKASSLSLPPRDINQALMELGALLCSKDPDCRLCPVREHCKAFKRGCQSQFPPSGPKKVWKHVEEVVICLFNTDNEILIRKTPAGMWRAGLWDLFQEDELETDAPVLTTIQSQAIVTNHKIRRQTLVIRVSPDYKNKGGKWFPPHDLLNNKQSPGIGAALKKSLPSIIRYLESISLH